MAIYRTGKATMDAKGVIRGEGTKWKSKLSLIRAGATIIFATNPVKFAVISEVVDDTTIQAISMGNDVVSTMSDYVILVHDSLTVDGLAQDVAETLRYYQGKENQFAHFIEVVQTLDHEKLQELINQIKEQNDKFEENFGKIQDQVRHIDAVAQEVETNKQLTAEAASTAREYRDEASDFSATAQQYSREAAQSVEDGKAQVQLAANQVRLAAEQVKLASAEVDKSKAQADRAKEEADRAADLANQADVTNLLRKDKNLSDLTDVKVARRNVQVDRLVQDPNMTRIQSFDPRTELRIGQDDWFVYRDAQDSTSGYIPLGIKGGGTGGESVQEVKENFEIERFVQVSADETQMQSGDKSSHIFIQNDGNWGAYDNGEGDYIPLSVGAGGTGAKDAAGARKKFGLDRVVQSGASTNINYPTKNAAMVLRDSDLAWGVYDNTAANWRALGIGQGGTGANDAAGARVNLEVVYRRRSSLGGSDNLNSIFGFDKAGIYYNAANANATTANNYPIQQAGVLVVQCSQANGVNQTMQYYYPFAREDIYFARAYNLVSNNWQWGGWKEYASLQNIATRVISVGGIKTTGGIEIDLSSGGTEPAPSLVSRRRDANSNIIVSSEIRANQNGSVEWIKRDSSGNPRSVGMTADNYFTFSGVTPAPNAMELGKYAANNPAFIDFHYGAKYDYDARIICDGMNRDQAGGGNLRAYAGYIEIRGMSRTMIQNQGATVIGNGASIIMQPNDASQACYLLGRNNAAANQWYIGRGGADDNVSFHSYTLGTTVQLRSGDVYINKDITTASGKNIVVNGSSIYIDGASGTANTHLWFRNANKKNRAVIYTQDNQQLNFRSDNPGTGASGQVLSFNGANGEARAVKFTATSDERAKFWIKPVTGALDKICELRGVTYSMHTTIQNTVRNAGVIAQDVQKVLPEAVSVGETGGTLDKQCREVEAPLSLDYNALSALYVEAFKELKAENDALKAQVADLQTQINQIMATLATK